MSQQRKIRSADFKAKVALAAIKGQHTINEIASSFSVHPNQVMAWKKQALNRSTRHWDTGPIVTSECNVDFHWPIR